MSWDSDHRATRHLLVSRQASHRSVADERQTSSMTMIHSILVSDAASRNCLRTPNYRIFVFKCPGTVWIERIARQAACRAIPPTITRQLRLGVRAPSLWSVARSTPPSDDWSPPSVHVESNCVGSLRSVRARGGRTCAAKWTARYCILLPTNLDEPRGRVILPRGFVDDKPGLPFRFRRTPPGILNAACAPARPFPPSQK